MNPIKSIQKFINLSAKHLTKGQVLHVKGIHWEGNNLFFENNFFKQMAEACSIFTLDEWVQLSWAAFDIPITVVPLKVALGYKKFVSRVFKKINHGHSLDRHLSDCFLKCPKIIFFPS